MNTNINPYSLPYVDFGNLNSLPETSAIYFVLADEVVLYVGKAVNLKLRWRNHHRRAQLKKYQKVKISWFEYIHLDSLVELENLLIRELKPKLNGTYVDEAFVSKPKRMSWEERNLEIEKLSQQLLWIDKLPRFLKIKNKCFVRKESWEVASILEPDEEGLLDIYFKPVDSVRRLNSFAFHSIYFDSIYMDEADYAMLAKQTAQARISREFNQILCDS